MKTCDETIRINLNVTKAVIDRGHPKDGENCPIAIAATEAIRAKGLEVYSIEVDSATFTVCINKCEYRAHPRVEDGRYMDEFIEHFDSSTEKVNPFSINDLTLELVLPEPDYDYD